MCESDRTDGVIDHDIGDVRDIAGDIDDDIDITAYRVDHSRRRR